MDCLREAESARRPLYFWRMSIYCYDCPFISLWFVILYVAILVTLFLELLMYIENIIVGLLTRSWIRPKAFVKKTAHRKKVFIWCKYCFIWLACECYVRCESFKHIHSIVFVSLLHLLAFMSHCLWLVYLRLIAIWVCGVHWE